MINFEAQYFQKMFFAEEQIKRLYESALHDLDIADKSDVPDVIFKFSYDALIKLGIAIIAKNGFKIRSVPGHHIKILEKLSQILDYEDVIIFGNKMRQERNTNLYGGDYFVAEKDSLEYLDFAKRVFKKYQTSF
jgi:hypothetical protein